MFAINEVFKPVKPLPRIKVAVRIVDTVGIENVVLIDVDENSNSVPFKIRYEDWVRHLQSNSVKKIPDPYLTLSSRPGDIPIGASIRYKLVIQATATLSRNPGLLHDKKVLSAEFAAIAKSMGLNARTIKRWVCEWLRTGRNPAAVVRKFSGRNSSEAAKPQARGKKRGQGPKIPGSASNAPAYEVESKIKKAYDLYICKAKMNWRDAFHEMLIKQCDLPEEALSEDTVGVLLDPALIEKYRLPTWSQFRYRCRRLKKAARVEEEELPRGERGKAADDVYGPGFFEIDATFFQIQLVSRVTKSKLVSRPTVYLIVDIYTGAIVGYAVTLENPSWATAALALYNCFTDKGPTFERLGLPFESKDWPCRQLPNVLRADRAELISNMGQEFPASGIRVEVTPSMTPIAKGTVEGKHAEIKRSQPGRFNLPGRYAKIRKRRDPDGKKDAALDILEFERILVEIIMDINREPVDPKRLPPDALPFGAKVASRIGFYEWALEHRAGYTRDMGPNFAYEHLLTKANGIVTPQGVHVRGETFNCDRLRALGYLVAAIENDVKIPVSYNPLLASEVFFLDRKHNEWVAAHNIDPEISRFKASFAEAENYRSLQRQVVSQGDLNAHNKRRQRIPVVREAIKDAMREKAETNFKTSGAKANIRENRAQERANERSTGLNGALPTAGRKPAAVTSKNSRGVAPKSPNISAVTSVGTKSRKVGTNKVKSLWEKVNAIGKK